MKIFRLINYKHFLGILFGASVVIFLQWAIHYGISDESLAKEEIVQANGYYRGLEGETKISIIRENGEKDVITDRESVFRFVSNPKGEFKILVMKSGKVVIPEETGSGN